LRLSESPDINTIRYRLVARITSTSDQGLHFKTTARAPNNMVFELDGMARHTHTGIQQISQLNGSGYGRCLNPKGGRKRDISCITSVHPRTVAVFYILEIGAHAQRNFFHEQCFMLRRADEEGPIELSIEGGRVKFGTLPNCINTWISTPQEEINWRTQHPEREFKLLKVLIPVFQLCTRSNNRMTIVSSNKRLDLLQVSPSRTVIDSIASRQRVSRYDKKPKILCLCGDSSLTTLRTLIRCVLCGNYSHLSCQRVAIRTATAEFACKACTDDPYLEFNNLTDLKQGQ